MAHCSEQNDAHLSDEDEGLDPRVQVISVVLLFMDQEVGLLSSGKGNYVKSIDRAHARSTSA